MIVIGCHAPPGVAVRPQTTRANRDEGGQSLNVRDAALDVDASLLVAPARDADASDRPGDPLVAENLGTACAGPVVPETPWRLSEPVSSPDNAVKTRIAAQFLALDTRITLVLLVGHARATGSWRGDLERSRAYAEAVAAELAVQHVSREHLLLVGLGARCPYRLPTSSAENDLVSLYVARVAGEDIPPMISCANGNLFRLETNGSVTRLPAEARWRAPQERPRSEPQQP
jgi:hypothetical protein